MRRRLLQLVRIASVVAIAVLLLYVTVFRFTSAGWKNPLLFRMFVVDDLQLRHQLVGVSRPEINELLGVPNSYGDYVGNRPDDYVYYLGPQSLIGADSNWLRLQFQNDRVVATQVFHD